jgi:hypothetical protein
MSLYGRPVTALRLYAISTTSLDSLVLSERQHDLEITPDMGEGSLYLHTSSLLSPRSNSIQLAHLPIVQDTKKGSDSCSECACY